MLIRILIFLIGSFCSLNLFASSAWELGIYMQADNNLRDYALWDLAEISKGLENSNESDRPKVLVALDLPGDDGYRVIEIQGSELRPISSVEDASMLELKDLNYKLIAQFSEDTSQKVVLEFLMKSLSIEKKSFVSIWGHGEGFSGGQLAQFGGVAIDDSPRQKLSVKKIAEVLSLSYKKLDLLIFDACLMQTLEVSFELKDYADYIGGSTQIHHFKGLPYTELIELMAKDISSHTLALDIPGLSLESIEGNHADKFTMSVVNTAEMQNIFLPEFEKTIAQINKSLSQNPFLKLDLLFHLQASQAFLGESRDLSSFLSYLQSFYYSHDREYYQEIEELISNLRQSFSKLLVSYSYGEFYVLNPDFHLGSFKAFGLWVPLKLEDYQLRRKDFEDSLFFQSQHIWSQFLENLHSTELSF